MDMTLPLLILLVALSVPLLSFLAVVTWVHERRKEREAYYLSETIKKLADSTTTTPADYLRNYELARSRRFREGIRLTGFIGSFAATGLVIAVWAIDPGGKGHFVALIPLFACVSLFVYAHFLARRD